MAPFRSEAQKKHLFAKEPRVARKFAADTPKGKKLPEKVHPSVKAATDSFKRYHKGR